MQIVSPVGSNRCNRWRLVTACHVSAVIFSLHSFLVAAEDQTWTQFRGPTGQGHSPAVGLPTFWSATDNIVWQTDLPGEGHSSPVVGWGLVWLTTATLDGTALGAIGLDYETGDIRHNITLFRPQQVEEIHHDNTYASPTPVLEEGRLYCHFGTYGTACVETTTGNILWRNEELKIEHQGGPGSSPILHGDLLIIPCDGANIQELVALDTLTGAIRWRQPRSAPFRDNPITRRAFSTPLAITFEDREMVISIGADQAQAYDPLRGEELWHVRYVGFSNVPAPVYADGTVYLCTGYYQPELWAVDVTGTGDVTKSHVRWRFRGPVPETPSPLIVDHRIYLVANNGVLTCLDALTGDRLWVKRLGGNYSASPLYADGRIYVCSEGGVTHIFSPGERPDQVQTNTLPGVIKASPVAVGRSLLIRTDRSLYRIESVE